MHRNTLRLLLSELVKRLERNPRIGICLEEE
jgi:hypothetical protein